MAVKEWFRRMRPVQLYVMLAMTTLFFLVQLVMSHMAHALTLLVDSCHMLCNLIALTGCIITIKYGSTLTSPDVVTGAKHTEAIFHKDQDAKEGDGNKTGNKQQKSACAHSHHAPTATERRLRNTFGWARIDVLVMLIGGVFLASLCFSLVVEALQELAHSDHHDEMHHPIAVMCVGAAGLLLNGLCYLLIGGYTFHQGSFLHVTASGEVVLDHSMHKDSVQRGQRRLSSKQGQQPTLTSRQGFREMFRDIVGCLFVITCSAIVYFTDQSVAKFVDPIFAIVSAVVLLVLSYPYMKEAGAILLQTIPDHINIAELRSHLLCEFPDIVNVHDLHVWQLTQSKVVSTVHIIFLNPKDYTRIILEVTNFFYDQGITQVTIQPEFFKADNGYSSLELLAVEDNDCLVKCSGELCHSRHCCSHTQTDLTSVVGHGHSHGLSSHSHSHNHSHNHTPSATAVSKCSINLAPPSTHNTESLPPLTKSTPNDTDADSVPTLTQVTPNDTDAVPTLTQAMPNDTDAVPTLAQETPNDTDVVPTLTQATPNDTDVVPTLAQATPNDTDVVATLAQSSSNDIDSVPTPVNINNGESLSPPQDNKGTSDEVVVSEVPVIEHKQVQAIECKLSDTQTEIILSALENTDHMIKPSEKVVYYEIGTK